MAALSTNGRLRQIATVQVMQSNTSKQANQHDEPLVAVGYGGGIGSGGRAIEHLAQIAVEAEMVLLHTAVRRS